MKLSNYQQTNKKVTKNHKKQSKNSKKAKSSEKKSTKSSGLSLWGFLTSKRMVQVYGILLMAFAVLLCISIVSSYFHFHDDYSQVESHTEKNENAAGTLGAYLAVKFISYTFGFFSVGFVLLFFIYGFKLTFERSILPPFLTTLATIITMAWFSTVFGCFLVESDYAFVSGAFGNKVSKILTFHTHYWGTGLILFATLIIILVLFYNISPKKMLEVIAVKGEGRKEKGEVRSQKLERKEETPRCARNDSSDTDSQKLPELYIENMNELRDEYDNKGVTFIGEGAKDGGKRLADESEVGVEQEAEFKIVSAPIEGFEENEDENDDTSRFFASLGITGINDDEEIMDNLPLEDFDPRLDLSMYKFPSLDLLNNYEIKEIDKDTIMAELMENKDKIETTLKHFGIFIKQISVTMGPTVTLYEIVPADGIRIAKIKNLEDDIALNLAALGIRIIAPIPGKGTIGIEVPNKNAQLVSMKEIIHSDKFQNNKFDLPIGLGKTISNEPFVVDLAKMPHLLMAGATGQGKSVGLNAIITSLLYKKHPSELKFVLIDPKRVELTLYSVIENHYLAKLPDADNPIITDTKKVVQTLNSLCVEMDKRLGLLNLAKVRNIKEYNQKFCSRKLSPALDHDYMPYIVLIIDEFADLIMTEGREVEVPIARLAQLSRAIGIHLIIATQRPSVNIIKGSIKANFPARLAFRVVQKVDSQTILDANGADRLIGKGDMLLSTGSDLIRLQCAFVDTPEVERIANFIEEQQAYPEPFLLPEYIMDEKGKGSGEDEFIDTNEIDNMFMEAATLIVQSQMGSTSLIQRKLKLGYNRAGRIMDQMEEFGIVGPSMGSKAREVKVKTVEELNQVYKRVGLF
ncbi:MAG: DNA translocase FtsK [Bacteroidales bacterium]|jgi:S-DNA-T family DNA segregation ATPase FtsK/SpoIIIE|nr:DNA translocase FtsK [Bacteroidales bacterium]